MERGLYGDDGARVHRVVLAGGGCPAFGVYTGLFRKLDLGLVDFAALGVELVTSSAGSMYVAQMVARALCDRATNMTDAQLDEKLAEMHARMTNVSLWDVLEEQRTHLIGHAVLFNEITQIARAVENVDDPKSIRTTFAQLREHIPALKLTVLATYEKNEQWFVKTFNADETPDVPVCEACMASMSVPIMFQPYNIQGVEYFDSDITDFMAKDWCNGDGTWHIRSRVHNLEDTLSSLRLGIPFVDTVIRYVFLLLKQQTRKSTLEGTRVLRHDFVSDVMQSPVCSQFRECGERLANEFKVILKESVSEQ
tara:strand:+ start:90 stop:1016 length:927 start_codon:yes stop_codon:yes gene_type:complete